MKYSLRYIILAFPLFLCLSCVDQMQDKAWNDGDFVLDLSVSCMKTDTKAGPELWPGIEEYNENKVAYVDWYVFKSATDTDNALLHGRATITQTSGQIEGLKVTEQDMGQYVTDSQRSFYVYTIANMPELTHDAMPKTLAGLQALELAAGFNTQTFAAQESFVMAAGQSVTFTDPGLTKVTNKLSRLASKVSVNMNVTPAIDQFTILSNGEWTYMRTWYPELASIQVYLSFANSATTVKGEAVSYDQDTFFTYYRTGFKPEYSYTGDTAEQYSTSVPATTPVWSNEDWRWKVKGSPFYSYPMQWAADSPQAPFIKVILKWTAYIEDVDSVTVDGETKIVPRREKKESALDPILENREKEFYYKIPLPGTILNANDWYDLTFNIAILGSTADELPVELAGQYCVMNWSDPEVHAGGELKQGRYLTTASDTYYMYGADEIEIPVTSSHALATGAAVVTKREVLYKGSWVTTGGNNTPAQVRNLSSRSLSVTAPGDGRSALVFQNALNKEMNNQLDCFPMRFTLNVRHGDGNGPSKVIRIMQYPPIYVDSDNTDNSATVFINNYDYTSTAKWAYNNYTNNSGRIGAIGGSSSNKTVKTIVSVSSLANLDTAPYTSTSIANPVIGEPIIGDPRVPLGPDYLSNPYQATQRWGTQDLGSAENNFLANYLYAAANKQNVIAPKIMVASGLSGTNNVGGETKVDWVHSAQRCASYQEDGYPAGRWRMPTEAEIYFVYTLGETLGLIDNPFTTTSYYWANSGRLIHEGRFSDSQSTPRSVRCVYDLWYWGDDPVATGTAAQNWLRFMTD